MRPVALLNASGKTPRPVSHFRPQVLQKLSPRRIVSLCHRCPHPFLWYAFLYRLRVSGDDSLCCFLFIQNMPKQIKEVKDFILTARRKDAKSTLSLCCRSAGC
jgi:hypothetical protein